MVTLSISMALRVACTTGAQSVEGTTVTGLRTRFNRDDETEDPKDESSERGLGSTLRI